MSAFNEVTLEDRRLNRLVRRVAYDATALAHNASPKLDSFNLWKTICMSRLLKGTTFILLLNKSDILKSKLEAGVSFARYVKSYKDGANEFDDVCECELPRTFASAALAHLLYPDLKRKFVAMCKHNSARERQLHVHVTCATVCTFNCGVLCCI